MCVLCGKKARYRVGKLLLCKVCGQDWTDRVIEMMR